MLHGDNAGGCETVTYSGFRNGFLNIAYARHATTGRGGKPVYKDGSGQYCLAYCAGERINRQTSPTNAWYIGKCSDALNTNVNTCEAYAYGGATPTSDAGWSEFTRMYRHGVLQLVSSGSTNVEAQCGGRVRNQYAEVHGSSSRCFMSSARSPSILELFVLVVFLG